MSEGSTIYLRNLHGCETRVSLTGGRNIELQPRGQRGDMESITEEEYADQKVKVNIGLVFEPISAESAAQILEKQDTNRKEPHAAFAMITNALGDKYDQPDIKVEKSFEDQGIVVGEVADAGARGNQERRSEVNRPEIDHQAMQELIEAHGSERAAQIVDQIVGVNRQVGPEKVSVPGSQDVHTEDPADHADRLRANSGITEPVKDN